MVRANLGDDAGARRDLEQAANLYLEQGEAVGYRKTLEQMKPALGHGKLLATIPGPESVAIFPGSHSDCGILPRLGGLNRSATRRGLHSHLP